MDLMKCARNFLNEEDITMKERKDYVFNMTPVDFLCNVFIWTVGVKVCSQFVCDTIVKFVTLYKQHKKAYKKYKDGISKGFEEAKRDIIKNGVE